MSVIPTRDQVPQIVRVPGAIAPPRATHAAGSMTGQDVFRILRKRKWLIILSVVICLAAAAVVTQLWLMFYPLYTASAFLAVNPPESPLEVRAVTYTPSDYIDRLKMSFAKMAKTKAVLDKMIEDPSVSNTVWYRNNSADIYDKLESALDSSSLRETNLIQFSMTGPIANDASEIANAWASAFVKDAGDSAMSDRKAQIDDITSQQNGLKSGLSDVERDLRALPDTDERVIQQKLTLRTQELQALATEQMKAQLAVDTAARQKKMLDDMEAQGQIDQHPQVQQYLDMDPLLRSLTQELVGNRTSLDQLRTRFGTDQRVMQDVQSRIDSLERQVADQEKRVRKSASDALKDGFTRQLAMVQGEYVAIQARADEIGRTVKVLSDNLKTATELFVRKHALETNIDLLDRRLLELRLLQRGERPVYVRRFASRPLVPSIPRWGVNLVLGGLMGLIVGLGLTFLLEMMDTSIKNPTDVSRRVDLPMLGMVPHLDDLEEEIADLRLAFMTNPNSLVGESFRQIRTTLQFSAPAAQLRTILVTSALPGDGRSTVSLNLAAATAHAGRKVLVVEANFRQPMLRALFPQTSEAGLSNILVGQSHWKDLVTEVHPNLFVLTGGPLPPNPAELLGSDAMRSLLVELSSEYDQIILDGAPCLLVTDPVVLGTLVDGVVLVVRAAANTYGVVQRARDILGRVGARVLGVVLNGIRVTAGGYLRKSYRTYYEYHEQTPPTPPPQQLPRKTA
jgi:capsular exopolysaccharide synthesis family protein